jgi:methyltransferase of ATP-grasp peptide maturase system
MSIEPESPWPDWPDAQQMRFRLVEQLISGGMLRSEEWRNAFLAVPRHRFVPAFFRRRGSSGFDAVAGNDPSSREDWLRSVYTDDVLFTQVDGDGVVTSSSTSPGLMAVMIESLEIEAGMSVLEIGTGTGYNAALLCQRLGSALVTSVDIDSALVAEARERLASLGFTPLLAAGDGVAGYQSNAPYQRIIATASVPAIPAAWITQASHGGRILAGLHRELGGGVLVLLTAYGDHAKGRFLPQYAGFMPVRSCRVPAAISLLPAARGVSGEQRETHITGEVLDDPSFAFFAALRVPGQRLEYEPEDQPGQFWLLGADGSWARQSTDRNGSPAVCQHGPRRLWDALERVHADWTSLGSPPRQDFGLTVTAAGAHTVWSASDPAATWPLAPALP